MPWGNWETSTTRHRVTTRESSPEPGRTSSASDYSPFVPILFSVLTLLFAGIAVAAAAARVWVVALAAVALAVWMATIAWAAVRRSGS
jgi:hypothetical protein